MNKLLFFIAFFLIWVHPYSGSSQDPVQLAKLKVKVEGTGRTTGHVLTMIISNPEETSVTLRPGTMYIPATGKYQGYILPNPGTDEWQIGPGGSLAIPLSGYCTDINKPPVPAGTEVRPIDEWITGHTLPDPPGPGDELNSDVFDPVIPLADNKIAEDQITVSFPGTDIPFNHTIDIQEHSMDAAPLLFDAIDRITETFDSLKKIDLIHTPFSFNPGKEREAVIQQSFWLYTSLLKGDDYTQADFTAQLEHQFEQSTGKDVEDMDSLSRQQFSTGADQFWGCFELVGVEAKILCSNPEGEEEDSAPQEEEYEDQCEYIFSEKPDVHFEMKIDDSWKDPEERARIIAEARRGIELQGSWSLDSSHYAEEGGIGKHPTSVTGFFRNLVIGGYGSAYAWSLISSDGQTEWVSSTEDLSVDFMKSAKVTLQVVPAPGWTSFVVGSSNVQLRASSTAFDAVAGNSEYGLDALRIIKFTAKLALQYLIDCGTGAATSSFGAYARDALRDELESMAEEAVREKISEFLEDRFGELLEELGLTVEQLEQMSSGDLEALIENALGVEISTAGEVTDEGLDAALNLLFVSNTFASINGALVVKIGDASESGLVSSSAFYQRQELEDSEQAVRGTGPKVASFQVSDVKPGQITIETIGLVNLMAQAKGNGFADAFLESTHVQALVGVCLGPAGQYESTVEVIAGAYRNDEDTLPDLSEETIEAMRVALKNKTDAELNRRSTQQDWQRVVDAFVREQAGRFPFR